MVGPMAKQILICDDDPLFRKTLNFLMRDFGTVTAVQNTDEAIQLIKTKAFDLLLLDVQMRTPDEGLRALPNIRSLDPDLTIVMISGLKDFRVVREALKSGANDYLVKDFDPEEFKLTIERALDMKRVDQTRRKSNSETARTAKKYKLVGETSAIQQIRKLTDKFRLSTANVLIRGETGTGKEIVARMLRKVDERGNFEPFVAVDSATLHAQTAESILFGHERGAFTGADALKRGLFEEADGGMIFFDEVANMPLEIQAKLLRVLQEKEIVRLGSNRVIPLEFRVVAATNRDLEDLAAEGKFLPDLLQRLSVLPVVIPPLRERSEDLPLLVNHLIVEKNRSSVRITPEAMDALSNYAWPGNVRELSAQLDYSLALIEDEEIDLPDLHPKILERRRNEKEIPGPGEGKGFYSQVAGYERELLKVNYDQCQGNVSQLAVRLGMDRSHLHTKLKLYGIHLAKSRP